MSILEQAHIAIGVSGGIAAYKTADLASKLVQAGSIVDVLMTKAAHDFIGPMTFQAITRRPVHTSVLTPWTAEAAGHVTIAAEADALIIAPATANTIARLAHGQTDDMLAAVALSTRAPILLAPAMEHQMFHHPATQANLAILQARGATVIGPDRGHLASGAEGDGRMVAPEVLVGALRQLLGRRGALAGLHIVITSGGTREPLDPVRYLGNRSSGRMGHAMAQAAIDRGARVTLVTGATSVLPPVGAQVVPVTTAAEMLDATQAATASAHVVIMAAAVADYRPATYTQHKIKKQEGVDDLQVAFARNADVVASIDHPGLLKIGFAAETEDHIANARAKMAKKGLAMIVVNDAEATIGAATSTATLLFRDGRSIFLPPRPKEFVAEAILDHIVHLLGRDLDVS